MVNSLAASMRAHGIKKGDVVGMCMTVSPEAVAVMFAAMKIGAIPMQVAARVATDNLVENLNTCKAKILFINNGYSYGGKKFSLREKINAVLSNAPSTKRIVVLEGSRKSRLPSEICDWFGDFIKAGAHKRTVRTLALDAEHPALILFSSGSTGKPKVIVHTHGGIMANVPKEIGYAFDYRDDDVFYWATNFGWMMAPWEIIGVQFFGGKYVLYDGAPLHPGPSKMHELIERYKITIFGFTPSGIGALPDSVEYKKYDISSLRILGSTGSKLEELNWVRFFNLFGKGRCPIMNISGGTELIGCLVSPLPVTPQLPSSAGPAGLGMDVVVLDEDGNETAYGEECLLAVRKPFPSMTRGFWGNPDLYLKTYFPKGPDVWYQGDRAVVDKNGLFYIMGRDDDLIIRGGVKIDPVKIDDLLKLFYFSTQKYPRIVDAVTTGVDDAVHGDRIVSFIMIESQGQVWFSEDRFFLALKLYIRIKYDPFARPDEIYIVEFLPKTLSAKVPRKKYRKAYQGEDIGDISTIDKPEAFDDIRRVVENGPRI